MSKPDGGPAFPSNEWLRTPKPIGADTIASPKTPDWKYEPASPGMSLRDYFAGQMLAGVYAADAHRFVAEAIREESTRQEMHLSDSTIGRIAQQRIAGMCYDQADYMIAEREK